MIALAASGVAGAQSAVARLVPSPAEVRDLVGTVQLSRGWSVAVTTGSEADRFAAALLVRSVKEQFGWSWPVVSAASGPQVILRPLRPRHSDPALFHDQGYELRVERDSIVIAAESETGRYYGIMTLRELLRGERASNFPCVEIRDWPSFAWRGVSDDISHGQISTLEDFQNTIATLASYKANVYQLYVDGDFHFSGEGGDGRGGLTAAEMRSIVETGERHHVTVIPIFESLDARSRTAAVRSTSGGPDRRKPSGWEGFRASLAALFQSIFGGTSSDDLASAGEAARRSARARITELVHEVPGDWFHIGGDLAFDQGRAFTVRPADLRGQVVADYVASLSRDLKKQGRKTIVYADRLLAADDALNRAPRDLTVVYWNYGTPGADVALYTLRAAGYPRVQVSPGLWDWAAFAPNDARAFGNIATLVESGSRARAEGVVAASWGDGGAECLKVLNWPAVAYAADAAWAGEADSSDTFLPRFATMHYGTRRSALAEAIERLGFEDFPNPSGNAWLYHRAPRLRARDTGWIARMRSLEASMTRVDRLLRAASSDAPWNRDQIEYLDHVRRRYAYVAKRELLLDRVARLGDPQNPAGRREAARLRRQLVDLRNESAAIAVQYEKLWRDRYRTGTLPANVARLRRQTVALDGILADLPVYQVTGRR